MLLYVGKYPSIKLNSEYSMFVKFIRFNNDILQKIKSLPVRHYIPDEKVWEIPITDIDRLVKTVGLENLTLFMEFPEFDEYIKYYNSIKQGKKTPEELKEYYRTIQPIVDYDFKTKPRGHQIEAFNIGIQNDVLIITDVMGLGKSKEAIDIMDYRKSSGLCKHVLVICGVNSLKYNWIDEIAKHSRNNCQVIDGTKKKRLQMLDSAWMFYYNIINIEALRTKQDEHGNEQNEILTKILYMCNSGFFGGIIFDEFHKCNNHRSKQGQSIKMLDTKFKIALSGTPITKAVEKSWNVLNWLGLENSTYWNYVKRYCILGGFSGYEVMGYKNLDELHEKINRYQIRRTKDILDLPPKTHQTIYIEMTQDQKDEYKDIKRGIITDIESGEVSRINPLAATIKLRQYTDSLKIKALAETVTELYNNDEACVIFSCFKDPLHELKEQLKIYNPLLLTGDIKSNEERQRIVQTFQNDKNRPVIMGTIQAMGTGFTLTKSSYVLFLNKSWIVGENEQAEDRCHRIGTERNVNIISFVVKNSIDERVEQILANDKLYIDKVIDGKPLFKLSNKDLINLLLGDD